MYVDEEKQLTATQKNTKIDKIRIQVANLFNVDVRPTLHSKGSCIILHEYGRSVFTPTLQCDFELGNRVE